MSASTSAAARLLEHNCHAIEAGANLLKALANEKRLQILCLLAKLFLENWFGVYINIFFSISQIACDVKNFEKNISLK